MFYFIQGMPYKFAMLDSFLTCRFHRWDHIAEEAHGKIDIDALQTGYVANREFKMRRLEPYRFYHRFLYSGIWKKNTHLRSDFS